MTKVKLRNKLIIHFHFCTIWMVVNIQNDIDIRHESQTDIDDGTSPLITLSSINFFDRL